MTPFFSLLSDLKSGQLIILILLPISFCFDTFFVYQGKDLDMVKVNELNGFIYSFIQLVNNEKYS